MKLSKIATYALLAIIAIMIITHYVELKKDENLSTKEEEKHELKDEIPDAKARLEYARLLVNLNRFDEATIQYEKLLKEKNVSPQIKLELAELYSWEKKYDESLALYEELLEKNQEDKQLRRKYAFVLMWKGDEKKAAEELEKTLENE